MLGRYGLTKDSFFMRIISFTRDILPWMKKVDQVLESRIGSSIHKNQVEQKETKDAALKGAERADAVLSHRFERSPDSMFRHTATTKILPNSSA